MASASNILTCSSVIVATGLIALVDDCIKRHFRSKPKYTHQVTVPLTPLKYDMEFITPRAMVEHMFKRRNSGSSAKERDQRASPLRRHTNAVAAFQARKSIKNRQINNTTNRKRRWLSFIASTVLYLCTGIHLHTHLHVLVPSGRDTGIALGWGGQDRTGQAGHMHGWIWHGHRCFSEFLFFSLSTQATLSRSLLTSMSFDVADS